MANRVWQRDAGFYRWAIRAIVNISGKMLRYEKRAVSELNRDMAIKGMGKRAYQSDILPLMIPKAGNSITAVIKAQIQSPNRP